MIDGRFFVDYRLPGRERLVYGSPSQLMRIPDRLLNCVCFICIEEPDGGLKPGGTGFFVVRPSDSVPDAYFSYLVTARHCVMQAKASGRPIVLRLSAQDGTFRTTDVSNMPWYFPENEASDVAVSVAIQDLRPDGIAYEAVPTSLFATAEVLAEDDIGVGDELFCTGLFVHRVGNTKNIPIVRFGNIAAMPGEPMQDEDSGLFYEAYLAEIRSIGGLSGSPVFVRLGVGRPFPDHVEGPAMLQVTGYRFFLLGLIRGHWKRGQFHAADFGMSELESLNSGVAIVTPITDALEVIESEEFMERRTAMEKEALKRKAPTKDTALRDDGDASEFERFENLAREVVNTPKPKSESDEK